MVRCVQEPILPRPYKCEIWEVGWTDMSEEGGPLMGFESDDHARRVNDNAFDHRGVVPETSKIIGGNVLHELLTTAALGTGSLHW